MQQPTVCSKITSPNEKELKILVRQDSNAAQVMIELPDVIYCFLLLTFGESREQERCQEIGNGAHGRILFTHNLVIN